MSAYYPDFLQRTYFENLSHYLFKLLNSGESLFVSFAAEKTQFIRVNGAKIRQIGTVEEGVVELTLVHEALPGQLRKGIRSFTLTGLSYEDQTVAKQLFEGLRAEVPQLPVDPYAQLPKKFGPDLMQESPGKLLLSHNAAEKILLPLANLDVAGIYASGPMVRAMANSAGQKHWFLTENYCLDYSLYTPAHRALKRTFAGAVWSDEVYQTELNSSRNQLAVLQKEEIPIQPGTYNVFLAPAAVSDLISMLNWGGMSEAAIRQGDSPLRHLRSGLKTLSQKFTLSEDFREGGIPRFNEEGELAPECLTLIEAGKLINTLVNSRTAKEYSISPNQASFSETLRAPSVHSGSLEEQDVLGKLDTGLYLSNLHYLNWSDQPGGRITGMTRYACFWVEKGELKGPISNMRFDESIFHIFGGGLQELTATRSFIPHVGSYGMRSLGGTWCPGMLVSKMSFTL
jgi:predicted Zn-dependent protease